jgi:hypothetical protein
VYNGHPRDLKKVAVWQRCLIKLRFRLVVDGSNWPLLTGGRCSQVVVKSGLTVLYFLNVKIVATSICDATLKILILTYMYIPISSGFFDLKKYYISFFFRWPWWSFNQRNRSWLKKMFFEWKINISNKRRLIWRKK